MTEQGAIVGTFPEGSVPGVPLDPAPILADLERRLQVDVAHPEHPWLVDSVTIAIARVSAECHNPDQMLDDDVQLVRGVTMLAERVFHDPATRSRSVDAFGDPQFTGQVVPRDLLADLEQYWSHITPAPDLDEESEWTGWGFA